jgi:hypothetical protein
MTHAVVFCGLTPQRILKKPKVKRRSSMQNSKRSTSHLTGTHKPDSYLRWSNWVPDEDEVNLITVDSTPEALMEVPQFDIFSGKFGKGARWLEAVAELRSAETKMKLFAAKNPGHYFVYRHDTHRVVASIDTEILVAKVGA